ncbi:MAG: gliding motility-associated C-terminal domain-containing protein [Flavobacteriales bacterium]|nr:gliding motility-associated C-terminal domain-containing protein [Flavobacteriales bacterium]
MRIPAFIILLATPLALLGHAPAVTFTENRGQWPGQVLYRAMLPGGALFVEAGAFTYVQYSGLDLHRHARPDDGGPQPVPRGHAYRVHFLGGQASGHEGKATLPHYENHFIGNDPDHWGGGCAVHGEVWLREVWPGIDIRLDGRHGLKYDVLVAPGADPALARFRYEGHDGLAVKDRELHIALSTGLVVEEAPVVFHAVGGDRNPVRAEYALRGDLLSFRLPDGHDVTLPLTIDPVLTFSSFSGSTADNFGFTATYDDDGHLYGGGIVFGAGYPSTVGAFDPTFNGGSIDVGISKWTPTGNALVWSTYIGGNGNEAPHSLVVNEQNELYVMGSTGSANFPTTPGCFDNTFGGGPMLLIPGGGYGFDFPQGSDVFLTHLNAAGTALIGSTYIGGSGNDGVNTSPLYYNYGDPFRGEVALDPDGNPLVATCTASQNMPTSPGAPQDSYAGGPLDAYFCRFDPTLSTLLWGTYYGGVGSDGGFGIQVNSQGHVYVTGGTNSNNLPMMGNPLHPAQLGGIDGYVARFSPAGNTLLASTYLGTAAYDQSYFVQLDPADNVYVVGQTRGNYPVTPGKYANPGSSQFIHKISSDLGTSIWSTRIGNGSGVEDIAPSAFLVANCGQIYFSGWGGQTNNIGTPTNSNTNNLPITPGAYQTTTDGSDFYLMVLEPDAEGLNYATYFGGSASEHVDGGTSRFDKNGKVYQAVCAACGAGSFPTTPGAWSTNAGHPNCNLGVFKFDLFIPQADIDIAGDNQICFPATVQFVNNSTGGNTYLWDFGDGNTSTEFAPAHTYTQEGVFIVTMTMTDQYGCSQPATSSIEITSLPPPVAGIEPVLPICPGGSLQLFGVDAEAWQWSPPEIFENAFVQNPIATLDSAMTIQLVVTGVCGTDTAWVEVEFIPATGSSQPDVDMCLGAGVTLTTMGAGTFVWSPVIGLSDPFSPAPVANPTDTTTYVVTITTPEGCVVIDSVTVNVVVMEPMPTLQDTAICLGSSVQLFGPDGNQWLWQPAPGISTLDVQNPVVSPTEPTLYVVTAYNICGFMLDSAFVDVITVNAMAWPDTIICPGSPVPLFATGGVSYNWSPPEGLDNASIANPVATVFQQTTFTVTATDALGCEGSASLTIGMLPDPPVWATGDAVIELGDQVWIEAFGDGTFEWTPPIWLDCPTCPGTIATPQQTTTYTVTITAGNGCTNTATITIILNGTLFVPNTFTPNGDGDNDFFFALGSEIKTFRLLIFDRWGIEFFRTESLDGRWDGTYRGREAPIDTYVWRIDLEELSGERRTVFGHVNLIR